MTQGTKMSCAWRQWVKSPSVFFKLQYIPCNRGLKYLLVAMETKWFHVLTKQNISKHSFKTCRSILQGMLYSIYFICAYNIHYIWQISITTNDSLDNVKCDNSLSSFSSAHHCAVLSTFKGSLYMLALVYGPSFITHWAVSTVQICRSTLPRVAIFNSISILFSLKWLQLSNDRNDMRKVISSYI